MDSAAVPTTRGNPFSRLAGGMVGMLLLLCSAHSAATILDFDQLPAGWVINSGDSVGGITFTYDLGDVSLAVSTGAATTSMPNFLGTTDLGLLQAGDHFTLTFAGPTNRVAMYFLSSDEILAGDIGLMADTGALVSLTTDDVVNAMPLGLQSKAYFLALNSSTAFSAVSITFPSECGGCFLYNVDDISFSGAVPEAGSLWLLAAGLLSLGIVRLRKNPLR
jgi:hypothetical protein